MAKQSKFEKALIREVHIKTPHEMQYYVPLETDKDKHRFISSIENEIRNSMEYRDYVRFAKDHMDLNSCIFFQKITANKKNGGKRVTVELHHEPFTLYDIVSVIVQKYIDQGLPYNDLLITDEVLELHYENKVGLVPLSKTAHQMVHNSTKLMVPLTACHGEYSDFLDAYEPWIDEALYNKLEKKIVQTENLTPESFDALVKEFTYLDVQGFDDPEKMELKGDEDMPDEDAQVA